MTMLLLVGEEAALLEGLSQSLAALGYVPRVAGSLPEAREAATRDGIEPPLIALVSRSLAASSNGGMLGIPLAPGGALVLYHTALTTPASLPPALQRAVLADLTLPLERHRFIALVQRVEERSRRTGRGRADTPTPSSSSSEERIR